MKHKFKLNLKKNKDNNNKNIFVKIFNMPEYINKKITKVTIISNVKILIEGYKNIEDYYKHYIKIKGFDIDIIIDGKDLNILEMTDIDLVIEGEIISINYKK